MSLSKGEWIRPGDKYRILWTFPSLDHAVQMNKDTGSGVGDIEKLLKFFSDYFSFIGEKQLFIHI